jgi:hypothetical protein
MNGSHFPAELRVIQLPFMNGASHPGQALDDFDTTISPDGMLAWVTQSKILFALDKFSVLTPDGVSIVAAIGGGNWVAVTSSVNTLRSVLVRSNQDDAGTVALTNAWSALQSSSGLYSSTGSALFTVNTTTGVVTYNGAPFVALIMAEVVLQAGDDAVVYQSAITTNGALVGTSGKADSPGMITIVSQDDYGELICSDLLALVAGDTIQPVVRLFSGSGGSDSPLIQFSQMTIVPAG